MTTAEDVQTLIQEIFQAIADRETLRNRRGNATTPPAQERTTQESQWAQSVVRELAHFPWQDTYLPDGRTPPQPQAAVGLIALLSAVLEKDTIPPSSVNTTCAGGVAAEWHLQGTDLEISCEPDGSIEFSFEDPTGLEIEEAAVGDLTNLRQCVARLPGRRQCRSKRN